MHLLQIWREDIVKELKAFLNRQRPVDNNARFAVVSFPACYQAFDEFRSYQPVTSFINHKVRTWAYVQSRLSLVQTFFCVES